MIEVRPIAVEQLSGLKQAYIDKATAPLDGMWLNDFVPSATHFGFYQHNALQGFCCTNQDGRLLQFYSGSLDSESTTKLFESLFVNARVSAVGAFVSTAEPHYLSLCLDKFSSYKVNALMYQLSDGFKPEDSNSVSLEKLTDVDLQQAISFAHSGIGAPVEWLSGYFANLIARDELFGVRSNGNLIATGECRGSEAYQPTVADIGVIVAPEQRSKGLATSVLKSLVLIAQERGLNAICSTEKGNIAAQKAIAKAGFVAGNRILEFAL